MNCGTTNVHAQGNSVQQRGNRVHYKRKIKKNVGWRRNGKLVMCNTCHHHALLCTTSDQYSAMFPFFLCVFFYSFEDSRHRLEFFEDIIRILVWNMWKDIFATLIVGHMLTFSKEHPTMPDWMLYLPQSGNLPRRRQHKDRLRSSLRGICICICRL